MNNHANILKPLPKSPNIVDKYTDKYRTIYNTYLIVDSLHLWIDVDRYLLF